MVIINFLLDITIFSGDNFPCEMRHFRAIIGGVFMRKKYLLCFVLILTFVLSACGTSAGEEATDQELLDQYREREAQAEEIAPRLEAALYGVCDSDKADISVSNTSGTINSFVEVLSNSADRADFGLIVSSLATRFIELPV